MRAQDYRVLAVETVEKLLRVEHAVVWLEVEARLSDRRWGDDSVQINPHHLTTARALLLESGLLVPSAQATRGGRIVETYTLVDGPKRASEEAAGRKRLLHARYLGWAKGTQRHPRGLIGGAGESVTNESLSAAAGSGYRLVERSGGDVNELFGQPVPGGSLDNAAHLLVMEANAPSGIVTVPIEVKNIREWLYPASAEVYQLLTKASELQRENPDRDFVPVLVCRRAHKTLFVMAKQFGFYVIDARRQFLTPTADITDDALLEVRAGLGFADLVMTNEPDDLITKHFRQYLPPVASEFAVRWKATAGQVGWLFPLLRRPNLTPSERAKYMRELRLRSKDELGHDGRW